MAEAVRRFFITGKVQGVFFRHSTRVEALRLGLKGFARNLSDGSVEVAVQGPPSAIEQMLTFLGRGPKGARVDGVRETTPDPQARLSENFEVL